MSIKFIYPFLIIIFSVLIIYGIINNKNNYKLNNNVEFFANYVPNVSIQKSNNNEKVFNYFLDKNKDILKSSISNNLFFTKEMIDGTWTSDLTTVDNKFNVKDLIIISINSVLNSTNNNYGNITYNNKIYNIKFLMNGNLIAVILNNKDVETSQNLHIKFYNNYIKKGQENINPPLYKPEEFNSIISVYNYNTLIKKFASYKVYNKKVGGELYRIITSGIFYVGKSPQIYDYKAYSAIIGKYQVPDNYLTTSFGITNKGVLDTIITKYDGIIKFCIQRVFYSPSNNSTEIITNKTNEISLSVILSDQIPETITVCSFENDKNSNNLDSFFKPKGTILYFYRLTNADIVYSFEDTNNITMPNTSLNLKNNSSSIIASNIVFNNLESVKKTTQNTYTLTLVNRYISNLTDNTYINFSDLYNLL
jgi:hypothetical protein